MFHREPLTDHQAGVSLQSLKSYRRGASSSSGYIPGYRGWARRSSPAPSCGGGVGNEYGKAEGNENGSRRNAERESGLNVAMETG